jgi:hypothetical protein
MPVKESDLAPPRKGKKYKGPEFRHDLHDLLKNWGDEAQKMVWQLEL